MTAKPKIPRKRTTTVTRKGEPPREAPRVMLQSMAAAMMGAGESLKGTAEALGVRRMVLQRWLKEGQLIEAPPHLVDAARSSMGGLLLAHALEAASHITPDKLKKSSGVQLATIIGILLDKTEKLLGHSDTASVNINLHDPTPIDVQMRKQITELRQELARRIEGTGQRGDPGGTESPGTPTDGSSTDS
ncbi:MAG: hypothetical protein ACE5LB_13435 [Acidiferrobacterales bacterium]